jgi:Fe-S cluster biogenesis protein NfuA
MERPYHPEPMREPLPTDQPAESTAAGLPAAADATLFRRDVERVLALIRPSVQEDGGDIELVEAVTPDLVRIRFLGACVGCPSSSMTLHHGIERTLRTRLSPAIRVEAVS